MFIIYRYLISVVASTLSCWFNGFLAIRKGDIVRITHAFPNTSPLRIAKMENITEDSPHRSPDCGVMMSIDYAPVDPPITGVIVGYESRSNSCEFTIEEGVFISSMFVRAGERQKGQAALANILSSQLSNYVKLWDPYVSPETMQILAICPPAMDILILTEKIHNQAQTRTDAINLSRNLKIRTRNDADHDRFILTQGTGWHVGHSLKNFGSKSSYLSKLDSSAEIEREFDNAWQQATIFL